MRKPIAGLEESRPRIEAALPPVETHQIAGGVA